MIANRIGATAPTAETAVLYPHTGGGWQLCRGCFRPDDTVAHAIDPRTGTLSLLCADCYRCLIAVRRPVEVSPFELPGIWKRLARLHQNGELGEDGEEMVTAALALLASHLDPQEGWAEFEALKRALLRQQDSAAETSAVDAAVSNLIGRKP